MRSRPPPRDPEDWSIAWTGCGCGICDSSAAFLAAPTGRVLDWPPATDGRKHVHHKIDSAALPVAHLTPRQDRPFTLVLTQTDVLFTRAAKTRRQAEADLEWLQSAYAFPARR